MIIVEPTDPTTPGAVRLLDASHALMRAMFNPEDNHFLDHAALKSDTIRFFTARERDTILGCGALKIFADYGEVKSFYVDEAARGKGVGAALIRQIEDQARTENLTELKLETGVGLDAAHRLYERHGFTRCGPFGPYEDSAASIFMEKSL